MRVLDGAAEKQFVYVRAPGGYGKTVSVMLWLKKTGFRTAWHCFDEYDNAPAMFYRAFCLALLSAIPQERELSGIPRSSAFNGDPAAFTIEFLTRADYGRERIVLALDDFHAVTNEEIQKSLQHVLKRLPDSVTVFFLSRNEMPAHFDALKNNRQISLIGVSGLAFSAAEIQEYAACYRHSLTASQAEDIRSHTDGWIILLNMVIPSGAYDGDVSRLKLTVRDYYRQRWCGLDGALKEFLLKTSVPDHFTLELCEALTGDENSGERLERLIMGNANVSFSDGEYRYHQGFLEFLRETLRESDIDVSAAHRTAAEYCLGKNNIPEAYQYAIKSGDPGLLKKTMARGSVLDDILWDDFYKIINADEISDDMCDRMPLLYLTRLSVYLTGDRRGFERCMDGFYGRLPSLVSEYPEMYGIFADACVMDYRVSFSGFVTRMPPGGQTPVAAMPSGSAQMPFLHRDLRDYYELTDTALRTELEEFFRRLSKHRYEYSHRSLFLGIEAGLYMEQNRLDEALDTLQRAESRLNDKTSVPAAWGVYIMLAEASLYINDADAYERYKARAKAYFENRGASCYKMNHLAYEARAKLWNGDAKAAEEWLDSDFAGHSEFGRLYKLYQNFTTARACLVLGKTGEALSALEAIRGMCEAFNRPLDAAEADVLISLTEWGMGNKKEARERLRRVLAALYPRKFIRVVANEGKAVSPVLRSVLKNLEKEPDKDAAFCRYVKDVYGAAYEWSKRFAGLTRGWERKPVKLSAKQALILTLLSKGHKNARIVEMTGLSINTIKSYTKIAYQKLDVNNAADAAVKAKQLGILK
jgi:LuxR family maltose regulon positive regulatory protein